MDDSRNTDNAWFETLATHYHDYQGAAFQLLTPESPNNDVRYVWASTEDRLNIRSIHKELIDKVKYLSPFPLFFLNAIVGCCSPCCGPQARRRA